MMVRRVDMYVKENMMVRIENVIRVITEYTRMLGFQISTYL